MTHPGPRQRRPRRPGRGPDPRPPGPHRAGLPAGPGRQAQGRRRAARRRPRRRAGAYDAAAQPARRRDARLPRRPSWPRSARSSTELSDSRPTTATPMWSAKFGRMDQARKSRKRGRGDLACENVRPWTRRATHHRWAVMTSTSSAGSSPPAARATRPARAAGGTSWSRDNFDRVRAWSSSRAAATSPPIEQDEALQRALIKLANNMIHTFSGTSMGEWVNATKTLVFGACVDTQRREKAASSHRALARRDRRRRRGDRAAGPQTSTRRWRSSARSRRPPSRTPSDDATGSALPRLGRPAALGRSAAP